MEKLIGMFEGFFSGIGPFFLLLGLLIFIHELGHYLVAVWCGVRVETFSLGFGKKLFSFKRGHTTFAVSLIPLGGYVKMFGDDPTKSVDDAQKKESFLDQPLPQKIAIVLAGPLMNLFFAILIFAIVGKMGEPVPAAKLGDVSPSSAAATAGFQSGDEIVSVNGETVFDWKAFSTIVGKSADQNLTVMVKRTNQETAAVQVTPKLGPNPALFESERTIGLVDGLTIESASTMIAVVSKTSLANSLGIESLDVIEKINGTPVLYFRDLENSFKTAAADLKPIRIELARPTGAKTTSTKVEVVIDSLTLVKNLATAPSALGILGLEKPDLYFYSIKPNSPADVAGLKPKDKIVKINGNPISEWESVLNTIKGYKEGSGPLAIQIARDNSTLDINVVPEAVDIPSEKGPLERRFAIGIVPSIMRGEIATVVKKTDGVFDSLAYGVATSWQWTKFIGVSFLRLIQNEVSLKNVGGIISIGRVASSSYDAGWYHFFRVMAIISINLFVLNLLPVPVLDGGHLVMFLAEAVKGAPLSFRKVEIAQQVGLFLLMSLMVFALFNDITNLFSAW
jgi:regulator of sigma E protease